METNHSAQEGQPEILEYWHLIKAGWVLVVVVFLAAVLIAAIVTRLQPREYVSTTRINVESEESTALVFDVQRSSDRFYLQTETEIIKSQMILYPVIERLKLQERWARPGNSLNFGVVFKHKVLHPILQVLHLRKNEAPVSKQLPLDTTLGLLQKQLVVQRSGNTSLLKISVVDSDPERAAEIANTVAIVFREQRLDEKKTQMRKVIEKLREELTQQEQRLEQAQAKVARLRKELNVPTFAGSRPDDRTIQSMEVQLADARTDLVTQEAQSKELQKLGPVERRNAIVASIDDPGVRTLLQELTQTELRLAVLKEGYGPEHPTVRESVASRDKMQQQLDARVEGVVHNLEMKRKMAQAKIDELQKNLDSARKALSSVDDVAYMPFRNAEHEEEAERGMYETIRAHVQKQAVEVQAARSPVEVIDRAQPVDVPVRPNPTRNMLMGAVAGLVLGVSLVFCTEFFNITIKRIEDVEKYFGLPVLGVVPAESGLISQGDGTVRHIEVYRMLRANIEFAKEDSSINSVCLLSAGAGEGKSLTTSNLACVWAQHGMNVLVVDCDLHRPTVHNYLGVSNDVGLADYLASSKAAEEVIVPTTIPNLSVIPSGTGVNRNASLPTLTSQKIRELVQHVSKQFDVVLYDTPPVLAVSDASIVAREVATCVLVLQHRRYPRTMESRAIEVIKSAGGKLLGVVVNNVAAHQADMDYYYQSDYSKYPGAPEHVSDSVSSERAQTLERLR